MTDLTVFCVFWGDKYDKSYVYALQEMVDKYLTIEHDFKCITTQKLPGIHTVLPYVPYSGWWQKIGLFAPHIAAGPSIYLDLDVVLTGHIDYLAGYTDTFSAPANWAASGYDGIQSSVMCWPGSWHEPYEKFKPQWPEISDRLWGDQEFLWEMLGDDWQKIPGVGSYKYHCQQKIPDWMKVVVFHGKPDPHEVTDTWILPFTATLLNRIKSNTDNGFYLGYRGTGTA